VKLLELHETKKKLDFEGISLGGSEEAGKWQEGDCRGALDSKEVKDHWPRRGKEEGRGGLRELK
jgi:hypothetical protein